MRIYLIGMPGVGKSKTGKNLSANLGYEYLDLDSYLEKLNNKTIEEIFKEKGEAGFRELEKAALESLLEKDNLVVSCGGGIVLKSENKPLMKGLTIYLNAPLELIEEHLSTSSTVRPVLMKKTVSELYEERKDLYLSFADLTVNYHDYLDSTVKIVDYLNGKLKKKKVLVLNGPNLNMLGKRNKDHYGTLTLDELNNLIKKEDYFSYEFYQSNHEGALIDKLQMANYDAVIINAGGYTHTSVSLHDALEIVSVPKVEVHLSDVDNREDYRKINFIRPVCEMTFAGKKANSYLEAVRYLKSKINVI